MDKIRIHGGRPLFGEIRVSGAKNAALPIMAAAILTDQPLELENVPALADIRTMASLLRELGVHIEWEQGEAAGRAECEASIMRLSAQHITKTTADYELVRKMRASVLVLGPLLARYGRAEVSLPGGCAIGSRPIDLHLMGLQKMGAVIDLRDGYVFASAPHGLSGVEIDFPFVSVGATENLLMAASLARGETILNNAAREPEITDLAHSLEAMGVSISGIGTSSLRIQGAERLTGARYRILPDRIEAGTYAMAAAITDGEVELIEGRRDHFGGLEAFFMRTGIAVSETNRGLKITRANGGLRASDITTAPFPGFATDLQAQAMALLCTAEGTSHITETIFENRFMHVPELRRMGANIEVHGGVASVTGARALRGAPVMATDLRASVSLVLAGLAAEGDTVLNRVYHLDRGYEDLVGKLRRCGAEIERVPEA